MSIAIDEYLTTEEVASVLRVTTGRVRQFVMKNRLIPSRRIGRQLLFDRKIVAEFCLNPRKTGRPKIVKE